MRLGVSLTSGNFQEFLDRTRVSDTILINRMSNNSFDFDAQWGKSAHIDLTDCEPELLTDSSILKKFVKELIDKIGMKANGPCYTVRGGDPRENLEGYSAMQFIETSSVTVHLDEVKNRVYVDIFSCKDFSEQDAFNFSKQYFNAQNGKFVVLNR